MPSLPPNSSAPAASPSVSSDASRTKKKKTDKNLAVAPPPQLPLLSVPPALTIPTWVALKICAESSVTSRTTRSPPRPTSPHDTLTSQEKEIKNPAANMPASTIPASQFDSIPDTIEAFRTQPSLFILTMPSSVHSNLC